MFLLELGNAVFQRFFLEPLILILNIHISVRAEKVGIDKLFYHRGFVSHLLVISAVMILRKKS